MTRPDLPPPARIRPVLIDPAERRFLLVPDCAEPSAWSVPADRIRPGESLHHASNRYLRRELRLPPVRIATVTGRLPRSGQRPCEDYFVLVVPTARTWKHGVRLLVAPDAQWWTTFGLREADVRVQPDALLDLMDGYWQGWLPDGVVSLE